MSKIPKWIDPGVLHDKIYTLATLNTQGVIDISELEMILFVAEVSPVSKERNKALVETARTLLDSNSVSPKEEKVLEDTFMTLAEYVNRSADMYIEQHVTPFLEENPGYKVLPRIFLVQSRLRWVISLGFELHKANDLLQLIKNLYHPNIPEGDPGYPEIMIRINHYVRQRKKKYYGKEMDIVIDYGDYYHTVSSIHHSIKDHRSLKPPVSERVRVTNLPIQQQYLPWS